MLRAIFHESDLRYRVTDRHHSSMNSMGLARENDYVGLTRARPIGMHVQAVCMDGCKHNHNTFGTIHTP